MKVNLSVYCSSLPSRKFEENHKLAFSWLSLVLFLMNIKCIKILEESSQNLLKVTIASEEIEFVDRIVYETGIRKSDVQ